MLGLLLYHNGKSVSVFLNNAIVKSPDWSWKTQTNLPGEKTHLSLKLSKLAKTARLKISLIKANGELPNQRKSGAQRK